VGRLGNAVTTARIRDRIDGEIKATEQVWKDICRMQNGSRGHH
jgi:hypothetical protein